MSSFTSGELASHDLVRAVDVSRLQSLGWKPTIGLAEGLASTYQWFLEQQ